VFTGIVECTCPVLRAVPQEGCRRLVIDLSASSGDRASRRLDLRLAGTECAAAIVRIDARQ